MVALAAAGGKARAVAGPAAAKPLTTAFTINLGLDAGFKRAA